MNKLPMILGLCLAGAFPGGASNAGDSAGEGGQPQKAVVRTYLDRCVNEGDWTVWPEFFEESVSFNGRIMTMDDMKGMRDTFRSILPDMRMTVECQITERTRATTWA